MIPEYQILPSRIYLESVEKTRECHVELAVCETTENGVSKKKKEKRKKKGKKNQTRY